MRLTPAAALFVALAGPAPAVAAEPVATPAWPPTAAARDRMQELRTVMSSRDATPAQREAARQELAAMLRSPAAPPEPMTVATPPRAAIAPFPAIVSPALQVPQAPTASVVAAPRAIPAWPDAEREAPVSRFKVDPTSGSVMVQTPQGYVDPRTGHRVPRK